MRKRWLIASAMIVFLVACPAMLLLIRGVRLERVTDKTLHNGEVVLAALHSYKEQHGHYPDSLNALIPDYIAEVPPPLVGERHWLYVPKDSGQEFWIGSEELSDSSLPSFGYSSLTSTWDIDTK